MAKNVLQDMKREGLTFEQALTALKTGYRVARSGWNGKDMYLMSVDAPEWNANADSMDERETDLDTVPIIVMKTANARLTPWRPSQMDLFAEDWAVIE